MKKWIKVHEDSITCSGGCLFMLINTCLAIVPPLLALIKWDASYLLWWLGFVVEGVVLGALSIAAIYITETEEEKEKGEK